MKINALIIITLLTFCFAGCKATPVIVPKGSSSDLGVRNWNQSELDDKYAFQEGEDGTDSGEFMAADAVSPESNPSSVKSETEPRPMFSAVRRTPPKMEGEKRLALVIGNADYTRGGSLDNPVNDARSVAGELKHLGFDVIKYENAGQKQMKRAIDRFGSDLKNYHVGLFFYAGHGVQVKGANYLIPSDADLKSENDVEYDCVDAGRVLAKMEDAGSLINIIILDACRDNPFERSWSRSAKGRGLAFMNAPSGSLIAYATSPGKTASDGSALNGVYTSALLKHIKTPNIPILEMFQRVRVSVMNQTNNAQTPWESTSLKGNFYFSIEE